MKSDDEIANILRSGERRRLRPSGALEARSAAKAEEGDAADLDISAYADDPAFTHLIEDEDADEKSAADDESEDEEEDS